MEYLTPETSIFIFLLCINNESSGLNAYISSSVLQEVPVDLLQHRSTELFIQLLQLILREVELDLVLLGIGQDVLDDELPSLVAVLEVRELAEETVDAVVVEIFEELLEEREDGGIDGLLLLLLLGGVGLAGLLHELLVLLLDDHPLSVGHRQVLVRPDHHPFDQVLLQFLQAQQAGNGRIDLRVDCEDFLEVAADVDGNCGNDAFQQFGNIQDVHPVGGLRVGHEDVEGVELVVGRVIHSLLHGFRPVLHSLMMAQRPPSAEILAIDGEFQQFGIEVADVAVDLQQIVVEARDEVPGVVEVLVEVFAGVGAGHGNVAGEEVGPAAVSHGLAVEVDGEVGAVDLLGGGPEDFRLSVAELVDELDELGPGGVLQRGILLEDEILHRRSHRHLLLFLHQFFYIYIRYAQAIYTQAMIISD